MLAGEEVVGGVLTCAVGWGMDGCGERWGGKWWGVSKEAHRTGDGVGYGEGGEMGVMISKLINQLNQSIKERISWTDLP